MPSLMSPTCTGSRPNNNFPNKQHKNKPSGSNRTSKQDPREEPPNQKNYVHHNECDYHSLTLDFKGNKVLTTFTTPRGC